MAKAKKEKTKIEITPVSTEEAKVELDKIYHEPQYRNRNLVVFASDLNIKENNQDLIFKTLDSISKELFTENITTREKDLFNSDGWGTYSNRTIFFCYKGSPNRFYGWIETSSGKVYSIMTNKGYFKVDMDGLIKELPIEPGFLA